VRIPARSAALAASLLWAAAARAADAPFAVGAPLAARAIFGCSGVTLSDALVGSDGVTTWTAQQRLGHVASNGDVVLSGRTTVQGDVIPGPGRRAVVSPESKVTGVTTPARSAADCVPVGLAAYDAFRATNDNARIPKTTAGRDAVKDGALVLDGPDPLTLPPGTYVFSSIALSGRAHVLLSGETHVFVTGDVTLAGNSHLNPAGGGFRLRLVVAGAHVSLDTLSTVGAFLYAPSAAATFAGGSRLVGSVFAASVAVREASVATRAVDDTPPVLDLLEPVQDAAVPLAAVRVRGVARDGETAVSSVTVNGVMASVAADGSFDTTVDATSTHEVLASATNAAGLAASLRRSLCSGAPTVTVVSPASGSIVGARTGTVTGTCGSASTVTVNGVPAAVAGGTFHVDGVDFGPDGVATVTVVAANACASSTAAVAFVVDTLAPVVVIDSPAPGTVFGASPISVTGTFVEANLVGISVNGVTASIAGDRFTATVPIPPGSSSLVAVARDRVGRSGQSAGVSVSLDLGSPDVRITSPASGTLTAGATVTVAGVANVPNLAGVTVAGVPATLSGTTFAAANVRLAEGDNRLVAVAVDASARTFESAPVVVTLDTLPPSVALDTTPLPALTNLTSLPVSGTVADPHLAGVTVNGAAAVVSGGRFTAAAVPLVEGDNVLVARATDTLGHAADSNTFTVSRDTQAPAVAITSPAPNAQLAVSSVTVVGTVSDAHLAGVTVNGVTASVSNGQFTATLALPEGDAALVARAADAAGNVASSAGVAVTVDTLAPVVTIDPPADPVTGSAFVTVTGTVAEPHLLSLTVAGVPATVSGGRWVATNVPLVEGDQQLTAIALDTFGHRGESAPVGYRLDSTPPVLTMDAPAADSAACRAPGPPAAASGRVYGHAGARPIVTLAVQPAGGTPQSFTATLDAAGTTWTVPAVDLGSVDGTATLTASTTDALGHDVRVLRTFRVKASSPSVALLLDGGAMPGAAAGTVAGPGETPVLFGRALSPRVSVSDGPGSAPPAPVVTLDGTPWTGSPISAEGTHLLAATATDCAGHSAAAHALFTIDVTPPRLLSTTPADGAALGSAVTSVSGTSDPDLAAATVNGVTANVSGGAFSTASFSSKEGVNAVSIVLADKAGNRATFARSFSVKTIGPSVEILESGAPLGTGAHFFRPVAPVVRSNDPSAAVLATLNGISFLSGASISASGDYTLAATATDTLGHSATATATFKVDLTAGPAVDIAAPADGAVLPGPTVAVTGTASASVTSVTVNGRAATLAGTTWSLPDLVLPPDVPTEIVAIASDPGGRTASATRQVTVRPSGPRILILEPSDGARTNRRKIDVAGAVVGGPSATASGQVTVAGQTLVLDALGTFRAKDVPLQSGANTLTASATDSFGRAGTASVTVTTDTTAPAIALTADGQPLAEGASFARPFTLRVTITDDAVPVPVPTIRVNGVDEGATAAVTDLPIAQAGGYVLSVVARDAAGNESRADRSFVLASGGCAVSALDPGDGAIVVAPKVTLKGRSGDAASIAVTSAGQTFAAQLADGTFAAGDVPLAVVGANTLSVACTDRAGAVSTTSLSITRLADGAGPVVTIVRPAGGARQTGATVAVTGTVSDPAAAVTVNGVKASVSGGGFSAGPLPLVEGPNVLGARAVDAAGRSGEDRVVVYRDSAAPKVVITSPPDGAHVGTPGAGPAAVSVSGIVDLTNEPDLASVVVATGAGSVTATVDFDTGAFYASDVPLVTTAPGFPQAVTATATDTLGQAGTATVNVVYDPAAPALVLAQPVDGTRFNESSPPSFAASGDAWAKDGAIVSLNGGGLDGVAWDAPAADGRRHASFTAQVGVPAAEGAFGVIARVEEPSGAYANDKRLLFKDVTPPTVVDMQPADGAKQVDANEIPLVLFSETIRPSSLAAADGLTLTRLSTGAKAVGTFTVAGSAVAFAPGAAMVRGEVYRLRAGTGITDLAGHALAAAKEVTFTVAALGTGAPPVLDALPAVLCAQQVVVSGTAAPNAAVRVRDGSLSVTGNADASGRFAVTLPLSGNGWHALHAAAIDSGGAAGPEAAALLRVDCSAPSVAGATFDRGTGALTLAFSEAMNAASLTVGGAGRAITVSKADDATNAPQAATLSLSTDALTATLDLGSGASAWWANVSVRLSVGPPAADAAGNVMTAPYATVFFANGGGDLSGGFLSGTALDDGSGRPLAGADAKLYASGAVLPGAAPAAQVTAPVASTVTDGRGRFSLTGDIAAGRYALVLSRPGYTRAVRRLALEPSVGAVPFGSRLTPLAAQAPSLLVPGSGGSFAGPTGSNATVDFAPNALASATGLGVLLTPLSGQGLPEPLPLGYTPLAAAELRLIPNGAGDDALPEGAGTPFAAGAVTLTLPLPAGVNTADLYAARYDVVAGAWLALPPPVFVAGAGSSPGVARVALTGPGSVAIVAPDADPATRPPVLPVTLDAPLAGVDLPSPVPTLTATIALDPPVVSPTGRATARVVAKSSDGTTPWPSGLAVQGYLDEKLVLSGGAGELYEAPFSADLVLYHPPLTAADLGSAAPGAAGTLTFRVSPSPRAAQVLLDTGFENVRLFPFTDQLERGQVLGPAGGSVTTADGIEIDVPEGGLAQQTVVSARQLSASELAALPAVAGYTTVAGLRLGLSGATLARAATLKLNAPSGLPADAADDPRFVLAALVDAPDDGRGAFANAVARVTLLPGAGAVPAKLVAAPEASGSPLPFPGVTGEGVFLFLHASAPVGFVTGRVTSPNGAGIAGSRVTAAGLGTANLSVPGGVYAVPAPAGAPTLSALHPVLGVAGSGQVPSLAKGQVAMLDLVLSPVPPLIKALQPASGAADQPVGSTVSVAFTTALDPASVTASTLAVSLADAATGAPTGLVFSGALALSPDRTTVVFTPARPLPPGKRIAARFTGGVRDTAGTLYGGALPVDWSFTTSRQFVTGGAIHPEKIRILVPVNGVAQIVGADGALPLVTGGTTPWSVWADVDGPVACPSNVTQPANGSGGFTLNAGCPPTVSVTLASKVYIHILDPTGAEAATFRLGPFTTPDGKGFVASPGDDTVFTTAEGVEVTAPAAAFDVPTLVKVAKQPLDSLAVTLSPGLGMGAVLNVDFDGTAHETLRLRIPVTTASPVGGLVFAGTPIDLPWGRKLQILDVGRLVDDGKGGKLISTLEADQPDDPALVAAAPTSSVTSGGGRQALAGRRAQALPKKLLRAILLEMTARGSVAFILGATVELSAMTGSIMPALVGTNFLVLYSSLADAMVFAAVTADARYVLPAIPGKTFQLIARDTATGWILNSADYGPINPDTSRFYDLKTFPDGRGPIPLRIVDAWPFRLYPFRAPPDGQNLSLEVQLEARAAGGTTSLGVLAPPYPRGTSLDLFNLNSQHPASSEAQGDLSSQVLVTSATGDEMLAIVGPADLEPDTFLARPLSLNFNLQAQVADADLPVAAQLIDCGPIETFSCAGRPPIPLSAKLTAAQRTLELVPPGLLPRGHVFLLVPDKARLHFLGTDGNVVNWPADLPQRFWLATRAAPPVPSPEVSAFSSLGDTNAARDLLKFGNILLVGSATGNLLAVDVSRTAASASAPAPFAFLSPSAASQVRAFATDGHNRLFLNELVGASWAVKAVRVEDVWAAGQSNCTGPPASDWRKDLGCFATADGGVKVAFATGSLGGLSPSEYLSLVGSLPTGTPSGMQVLVDDQTVPEDGTMWEMADFASRFGPQGTKADADGFFDFPADVKSVRGVLPQPLDTVCGDNPYYKWQRVSVDNVSTGQVFSADVPTTPADGAATVPHVRGRAGDRFRVRFNRKALGYVAIVGSGISVVDLNRFYGRPDLTSTQANKSQCGRRIARYEAADIPIYANGVAPNNANDAASTPRLDGLSYTPALAVSVAGSDIRVDSVLTHYGSVRSTSPQVSPETLAVTPVGPPDDWKTPPGLSFVKKFLPGGVGPAYRDVLFAPSVAWVDRGIVGGTGGIFTAGGACAATPCDRTGPLLFYSLGSGGIAVFDPSGDFSQLLGRFKAKGHSAFHLAIDPSGRRLFAGGTDDRNNTIIDVWDVARANGGPTQSGLDSSPVAEPDTDPRLVFSMIAPWDTNHLGFDETGDGLVYTWGTKSVAGGGATTGGFALPYDDLSFTFAGVYRDPSSPPSSSGQPGLPVVRPSAALRPLGVPSRTTAVEERAQSDEDEKVLTPAFKLRVSLPGALAPVLKARVQSLRSLPDRSLLDQADIGAAPAPPGGPGWPDPSVVVTLRRLGTEGILTGGQPATGGQLSNAYNLYESDEVVVLVADPRAAAGYRENLTSDDSAGEGVACRRCRLPSYLDPKKMVLKDLLAAGPYLRAHLFVENVLGDAATQGALDWFHARKDAYPAPRGAVPVDAWADAVPSPAQVTLAEPALNPATWQGEAGVRVALGPGEALLGATDFATAGRGVDFSFTRSYRSGALGYGPLGAAGWSANLFAHLRFIPPILTSGSADPKKYTYYGEAQYYDGTGRVFTFYPVCTSDCPAGYAPIAGVTDGAMCPADTELDRSGPNGSSYCVQKGVYLSLQQLENGRAYRIVSLTHGQLYFNADGTLAEVSDRFRREPKDSTKRENTLRLSYDGTHHLVTAEDDYGRRYTFEYERDPGKTATYGLLKWVKDFGTGAAQRHVDYEFDSADPGSRLLLKVHLPQVDALQPRQSDPAPVIPEVDYGYVSTPPSASAPLHDKLGNARLRSLTLPQFLDSTVPRFTIDYDSATGRVQTITVPNTKGALSLLYSFDATFGASHAFLADSVTVTPPWLRARKYSLSPEGRISTLADVAGVPTFLAPAPAAGFPSPNLTASSRTPTTRWTYKTDGKLESVVAPDGGTTTLSYDRDGTRLERATPSSILRTAGAAAPGLSTTSSTVKITDWQDNQPRELSVEMEAGSFHKLLLDVPPDPPAPSDPPDKVVDATVGWVDDDQKIVVHYDKFGQRQGSDGAGVTGAPKVVEKYLDGEDADKTKNAGFPEQTTLGDSVTWKNETYDENRRGNPTQVSTTNGGAVTLYTYDAWDRVKSANVTGSVSGVFRPVKAQAEQAFDAAGHLARERHWQNGEWVEARYAYDAREQLVTVTRTRAASASPGGGLRDGVTAVQNDWDTPTGLLGSVTRGQGTGGDVPVTTIYRYEAGTGRVSSTFESGGGKTSGARHVLYDVMDRPVYRTDGDKGATWTEYDGLGRAFREALATGAYVERKFDAMDHVTEQVVYDFVDGAKRTLAKMSAADPGAWLPYGPKTTTTYLTPDGSDFKTTTYAYDGIGRLASVTTAGTVNGTPATPRVERTVTYKGNAGLVDTETDAVGNVTTYKSYAAGSLWPESIERVEQPDGVTATETYHYDALGRVGDFTSADGTQTTLTYDEAGNLTDHSVGSVTRHLSYDGWGNVTTALGPAMDARASMGYDALGRVLEKDIVGAGRVDKTFFTYDELGRLASRTRPQSATETFLYDPDGMLNLWTTRFSAGGKPPLQVGFDYDPANRLVRRRVVNASDYRDNPQPGFRVTDDADVTEFADGLSRLSRAGHVTGSTADLGSGAVDPATAVTFAGYDLRGLPAGEAVGSVATGLTRQYDVWGNSTRVDLPSLVSAVRSYKRTFDGLDRLTRVDAIDAGGPISGFGMTWGWAGVGRLNTVASLGPASLTHGFTYPGSSPVRLNSLALGTSSSPTAFGSFSYDWEFDSDFKKGRRAIVGAQRFVSGLGWSWTRDEARRLASASATSGDWSYHYGPADEFTQIVDSNAGTSDLPTSGPEGRLEKKGTTAYAYDAEGRRLEDARFLYTWDFRSRLVRAESKLPDTQGEVVDYAYDALGRLLTRTHRGALPSGTTDEARRPFKAQRGYLWDGDTLLAETSYNFDGGIVSRKDHVPGPGPDQTYQIKTDGRTFSLFKDEQGNPVGLLEETVSGKANLVARFLYSPYGDLHLEVGPEPSKAEFKTGRASLGPVDQTLDPLTVTGSLELTTTIALAPTTYDALKVETFDAGTSTWTDVPRGELTLGVDANPELLIVFRTAGWKKNTRYRFRVTTGLKDDFGRSLQLPDDVAIELQIPLDVTGTAPVYIRSFKLGYDTAKAAANELGGAFTGGISLGFTGAVADPFSGLLYLRNRWYDPASGTWLSQDPMEDRDSPNLYGFVGARPHEATDPMGLQAAPGVELAEKIEEAFAERGRVQNAQNGLSNTGFGRANAAGWRFLGALLGSPLRLGEGLGKFGYRYYSALTGHVPTVRSRAEAEAEINEGGSEFLAAAGDVAALYSAAKPLATGLKGISGAVSREAPAALIPEVLPAETSGMKLLPPGNQTTRTLRQVRALRGEQRWEAAEEYIRELYGSPGEQHYSVPGTGGRYVDSPVPQPGGGVLAGEVKTYLGWRTVNGVAVRGEVPLKAVQAQIAKDVWLRQNVRGYDPRWMFIDAPPSGALAQELAKQKIIWIQYH
jgi:RHS repeat-associated protein